MKITQKEIEANSITALADRPNDGTGRYGVNGLSASELKERMSALPKLIADRHNQLCDSTDLRFSEAESAYRRKDDSLSTEEATELFRSKQDSYSLTEADEKFRTKLDSYSSSDTDKLFRRADDSYSAAESDGRYALKASTYTVTACDNVFRRIRDSYTKNETEQIFRKISDSPSKADLENLYGKLGRTAVVRGDSISDSVNDLWEAVDGLWNGIGRRVIRAYEPYPAPPLDPSSDAEFTALLNRAVLEATGRNQPDGSDAVQILDSESPGINTCYTYYYWKPVLSDESGESALEGWYVASIYQPPSVTELRAYTKVIATLGNETEWQLSEDGLYRYSIPASSHGAGADNTVLVDMKLYIGGAYRSVTQYSIDGSGNNELYSDEPLPCVCAVRSGSMYWLNDLPVASSTSLGAVKIEENGKGGVILKGDGLDTLAIRSADNGDILARASAFRPLTPSNIDALFASKIHLLTQAEYDAISPVEGDLYLITDGSLN